jgi:hypothetical protein
LRGVISTNVILRDELRIEFSFLRTVRITLFHGPAYLTMFRSSGIACRVKTPSFPLSDPDGLQPGRVGYLPDRLVRYVDNVVHRCPDGRRDWLLDGVSGKAHFLVISLED